MAITATLERFHRQMTLTEIGTDGQAGLARSCVVIVGCGALGGMSVELLARAGVGEIVLIDRDIVETTNLQRQILFEEQDAIQGLPKVEAARNRVARINSSVRVHPLAADLQPENVESLVLGTATLPVGVIVDGLDNLEGRLLLNDVAVKRGIPLIYGGAVSTFGAVYSVLPAGNGRPWADNHSLCLRCLFGQLPPAGLSPSCDAVGVLGSLVALVSAMQVTEAMKVLIGAWAAVNRNLQLCDPWHGLFQSISIQAHDSAPCPCCAGGLYEYLSARSTTRISWLCGHASVQVMPGTEGKNPDLERLAERLAPAKLVLSPFCLRCHCPQGEQAVDLTLFRDGRAIIRGVQSLEEARRIYQQLLSV